MGMTPIYLEKSNRLFILRLLCHTTIHVTMHAKDYYFEHYLRVPEVKLDA